jgi:hypothetical protein
MPQNPFLRPLPSRRTTVPPSASASTGQAGVPDPRAQALRLIAQDVHDRTSRIERLRAIGKLANDELKSTQHVGSSRIAWLAQQLNQVDSLKPQDL